MRLDELGLIGNCRFSALVERTGEIVWCCLPRFDSEPVFSTLLDHEDGGSFIVGADGRAAGEQRYVENTNVLETTFRADGGSFRVLDFAPRFFESGRLFLPPHLVRVIEPIDGTPSVSVRCDPRAGWSKSHLGRTPGSKHVDFDGLASRLRLTTDIPLSRLDGKPFPLTERKHLVLTWGTPIEGDLAELCGRFLAETVRYWQRWVKHCNVPPLYQREVIRSALALKLHCFEDTGAIVAAMTTSIPEAPASGRNWDYRYCWLRDAYYVLGAFRRLGHFEERERFTRYLLDIAGGTPGRKLSPVYRVDGSSDLEERVLDDWPGFGGNRPVRVGNAAALYVQNDIYGEMVLALAPLFFDQRFVMERTEAAFDLLEGLAREAISVVGTPGAGIWEYRMVWMPQTFSSLMSWAAADRMSRIPWKRPGVQAEFGEAAARIRDEILRKAWDTDLGAFVGTYAGRDLDASLLQMATLRFLPPGDPRLRSTIDAIIDGLSHGGWLFRYRMDDGFGRPKVAFIICTFWLVEALVASGREDEARRIMDRIESALSPLGLLSEDYEIPNLRMWGNFPQAYSHAGLIQAAFAASPPWGRVL